MAPGRVVNLVILMAISFSVLLSPTNSVGAAAASDDIMPPKQSDEPGILLGTDRYPSISDSLHQRFLPIVVRQGSQQKSVFVRADVGGRVELPSGARLDIPANALPHDATITMRGLLVDRLPDAPGGYAFLGSGVSIDMSPHGELLESVHLSIPVAKPGSLNSPITGS